MSLKVTITKNAVSTPDNIVSPAKIRQLAAATGNMAANSQEPAGVVLPKQRADNRLGFEQRAKPPSIRFAKGTISLTLSQKVYLSNKLTTCERKIWREDHESLHVKDNESIMDQMETTIRSDPKIIPILIKPQWYPRSEFKALQLKVKKRVGEIFKELVKKAVIKRDTTKEYRRIEGIIKKKCKSKTATRKAPSRKPATP